ncbi:MAG: hypothetical protein ABII68_01290 [Pseudomonadota bacterium]
METIEIIVDEHLAVVSNTSISETISRGDGKKKVRFERRPFKKGSTAISQHTPMPVPKAITSGTPWKRLRTNRFPR